MQSQDLRDISSMTSSVGGWRDGRATFQSCNLDSSGLACLCGVSPAGPTSLEPNQGLQTMREEAESRQVRSLFVVENVTSLQMMTVIPSCAATNSLAPTDRYLTELLFLRGSRAFIREEHTTYCVGPARSAKESRHFTAKHRAEQFPADSYVSGDLLFWKLCQHHVNGSVSIPAKTTRSIKSP